MESSPTAPIWAKDAARWRIQCERITHDGAAALEMNDWRREWGPQGPSVLDPTLWRSQQVWLCRLRSGLVPQLGQSAVFHGLTTPCLLCGRQAISRDNAARHLYECASCRTDLCRRTLWSGNKAVLLSHVLHIKQYLASINERGSFTHAADPPPPRQPDSPRAWSGPTAPPDRGVWRTRGAQPASVITNTAMSFTLIVYRSGGKKPFASLMVCASRPNRGLIAINSAGWAGAADVILPHRTAS